MIELTLFLMQDVICAMIVMLLIWVLFMMKRIWC